VVDQRLEYEELNKRILEFISWQEFEEGKKADLSNIEESQKDILFVDWDIKLKQAERAVAIATSTTNNIIEVVDETSTLPILSKNVGQNLSQTSNS